MVTDNDLYRNRTALLSDPAFDPGMSQLYDFSEVTEAEITVACIRELAQSSPFTPGSKQAMVVPSDIAFGLARMYGTLSDRPQDRLRFFRGVEEALVWLDQQGK